MRRASNSTASGTSSYRPPPSLRWTLEGVDMYDHKSYLQRQPKMRAILLDWLFEVSEFHNLHQHTTYLAQDYFDRFMLTQENISKEYLQLIGISALFIASKIKEIYPPKISEFAYITDGACDLWDIQCTELHILKALDWNLYPETPIS
ncbi:G1/S-specific cyclin-E2-like [Thalassophryne amazonica]|uniref:G1/S-specific cyclin-E2-like n=1 Tax=Thalassophryne amazonica TaxID=390379 RepID=UPI001471FA44|nr:G1/S-specific cyclin-E2-like [Thalassophryne amazonica]XP_034029810.1 G1/S-specific cyclin-E2-like [Thalassophryne amazonica]